MPTRTRLAGRSGGREGRQQDQRRNCAEQPGETALHDVGRVPLSGSRGDGGAEILGAGIAAEVGVRVPPSARISAIARLDRGGGVGLAENARASSRPTRFWPIGLAMPRPAMSGAEPCTGSNIDGYSRLRVDVARRRDTDRADHRRSEIGQDVAEQIGADHDVEPIG